MKENKQKSGIDFSAFNIDEAKKGNQEGFSKIISGTIARGLPQRELALTFKVPEWFISAWANGTIRPHPRVQQHVVEALQKRAEEIGK